MLNQNQASNFGFLNFELASVLRPKAWSLNQTKHALLFQKPVQEQFSKAFKKPNLVWKFKMPLVFWGLGLGFGFGTKSSWCFKLHRFKIFRLSKFSL